MNNSIMIPGILVVVLSAVVAIADTHYYVQTGNGWKKAGRQTVNGESAVLCFDGGICMQTQCSACHSQPMDQNRYATEEGLKHQRIHYPKAALRLGEGQKTALGSILATNAKGKLILQDQTGLRFQLPSDAYVVMGKNGRPAFITYGGESPPQLVR